MSETMPVSGKLTGRMVLLWIILGWGAGVWEHPMDRRVPANVRTPKDLIRLRQGKVTLRVGMGAPAALTLRGPGWDSLI